jgi:PAS domain-containing protein
LQRSTCRVILPSGLPEGNSSQDWKQANMIEGELRAIYYAPVPLVILAPNRTIKLLNRPAEKVLGIDENLCFGQRMDQFLVDQSRTTFALALTSATENAYSSLPGRCAPFATRLELQSNHHYLASFEADITISAWFPTDPVPISSLHPPATMKTKELQNAHEAHFTVSITPSSDSNTFNKRNGEQRPNVIENLKESLLDCIDIGIMALTKDGKTEYRNRACDDILALQQVQRVNPDDEI